jgi:GntR family transcriptional regulator, transcriptional repressor for pyruvate dehydrogenase complex
MTRLSSFAAQTLQRQIHEGQYLPGASLPGQRELSTALGISRTVLREAVSMLEALGIVRSQAGKGVFVTAGRAASSELPIGPLDMPPQAVFQFRSIIEPAAAALMARYASDAQIAALEATQARMQTALHAMDLVTAADADLEFHLTIASASANPMLTAAITALEAPIGYSLRLPFADWADPVGIWAPADEHRVVLDAISAHDTHAAHAAMLTHLVRAAARIHIDFETP